MNYSQRYLQLTLAVGSVRMVEPSHDVYAQLALENHDEDLSHVIEVYDFPSSFKTEDLFNGSLLFFARLYLNGKSLDTWIRKDLLDNILVIGKIKIL